MLSIRQNFLETIRNGNPDRFVKQFEYIKQYLLYTETEKPAVVWIGSANCSDHALLGANVEVMARFETSTDALYKPFPAFGSGSFCQDGTLTYISGEEPVQDPILPPAADEESFLRLRVTAASYRETEEGLGILRVSVRSGEEVPVVITLPRGEGTLRLAGKEEGRTEFRLKKKHFAAVLLARREAGGPWYPLSLPLLWAGYDLKTLTERLPLDPMESVRDLVPIAEGTYNPDDEAYERMVKWATTHPDDCGPCLRDILTDIDLRLAEYHACRGDPAEDEEDEEDTLQALRSAYTTGLFYEDLALLRAMAEEMLGREELV